jgi:hypothetical protein
VNTSGKILKVFAFSERFPKILNPTPKNTPQTPQTPINKIVHKQDFEIFELSIKSEKNFSRLE